MLVGFHVEGWDHLVLRAFLAKLLGLREDDIEPDQLDSLGRGSSFVFEMLPKALRRFYGKCAHLAVVGMDNDGDLDLMSTEGVEDPQHPRHWVHVGDDTASENCRWCRIQSVVETTRPKLDWVPKKPGSDWPVLIAVPVEAIEAWLLATQALLEPGHGSRHAEKESRRPHKQRFYGKPEPSKADVEAKALPLIREMNQEHLCQLGKFSRSFALFAEQVDRYRNVILGNRDCW